MSRAYEYADAIDKKVDGHLKSLGFNIRQPKTQMSIEHKIAVLNYLRSIETTISVVQRVVNNVPVNMEGDKE